MGVGIGFLRIQMHPLSKLIGKVGFPITVEQFSGKLANSFGAFSLQPVITEHDWHACEENRGEPGHSCGFCPTQGVERAPLWAKELDKCGV